MYIQYNVNNSRTDVDTMGANINKWYHQDTSDFVKYAGHIAAVSAAGAASAPCAPC